MTKITVAGNAPFPDIPEGRAVTVERTVRIDGLLASGRITALEEPPAEDGLPDTVAEVKAWVGDDLDRATQALGAEEVRPGGPRTTLLSWLEDLTAPDAAPSDASGPFDVPTFDYTDQPGADDTGDLTGSD